jgi:DNA-binding CsgD family transcriptional regulator
MDWEPIAAHGVGGTTSSPAALSDCSFDVSRRPAVEPVVTSLRWLDPTEEGSRYVGGPLRALMAVLGPAVAAAVGKILESPAVVPAQVLLSGADRAFRVVAGHPVDDDTLRVTVRCLDARLLPDLVDAKIGRVADASGLSERERQVLRLLLRGRGVEDIATMLEIAPRTVKFHQANVLQKLGADSRQDLLRVVL